MFLNKSVLTVSIFSIITPTVFAGEIKQTTQLETIQLQAHPLIQSAADFSVADHVIDEAHLKQRATTIGDALADELGVYSNQYGTGASRPVIRGQDGPRVKVLQHASETADVSTLSPDHAVTVDPILAKQVEVIRGPSTLLYSAGNVGGLVNVTDQKIPTQMPENGLEGSAGLRYNSGNDQKLASFGATAGMGENFALRVEGSKHKANDYITPSYFHEHDGELEKEKRVGNTFAEGQNVNIGGSWIHDRGFVGLSYSNRQDQYGLPGHSHEYHECHPHGNEIHCGGHGAGAGITHSEEHGGPWVDLESHRYDVRAELIDPIRGFNKLRAHASFTDYEHDELEENSVISTFKNKGYDARLELVNNIFAGWEGVIGTQFSQQEIKLAGVEEDHGGHSHGSVLMDDSKTQKYSLFGLEHRQLGDVHIELGARVEHQKIDINSDQENYSDTGVSGSAAANWEFAPNYKLSIVGSHQQRLPLAQELYADGIHFATNTYERGNENLSIEKSNNLELGLHYVKDKLDYHIHVYHNWFDNYIYGTTTDSHKDFRLVDYTQDKAKFYGAEGQVGYAFNDQYKMSVFGDYVRGKIENENAPRIPSGRLGTKFEADFADGWSGSAEYYHVFNQDNIASYETETQGYNMVNVGLSYAGQINDRNDYRVFLNANNLLDDQVYSHASFLSNIPQMGRNFSVGIDFGF